MADNALLRARDTIVSAIQRVLTRNEPEKEPETSLAGFAASASFLDDLSAAFERPDPKLEAVYIDMRLMDDSVIEVSAALDLLSENAMTPDPSQQTPFHVQFEKTDSAGEQLVGELFNRLNINRLLKQIAREALLMGNEFRQLGVNSDLLITDLMYLAPETIRIQTTEQGQLLSGKDAKADSKDGWAYVQIINESFKAGYYPWEVAHSKWTTRGGSLYGSPLFRTARWPWRKLVAMEDALVLNWLTRAFARLLFILDVTGKSDKEAQAYIKQFQQELNVARVGAGKTAQSSLSLVRDIFIGVGYHQLMGQAKEGMADVKVLDTSGSAFVQVNPLEYYRSKIIMAGRVPRAYLALEQDINAKATLVTEDRQYAKTLGTVQLMVGNTIEFIIDMQMLLQGMLPAEHPYITVWDNPSRADVVDESVSQDNFSRAMERYYALGVVDSEYIARKQLGMSQAEYAQIVQRQASREVPDNGGPDGDNTG